MRLVRAGIWHDLARLGPRRFARVGFGLAAGHMGRIWHAGKYVRATVSSVLRRRSGLVLVVLMPAVVGLVIGYLAIAFDWPISNEAVGGVPLRPGIPGLGFVILVVLGTVALVSLVMALRGDRVQGVKPTGRPGEDGAGGVARRPGG